MHPLVKTSKGGKMKTETIVLSKLQQVCRDMHMTTEELAYKAGMSASWAQPVIKGKRRISIALAKRIAAVVKKKISDLE